MSNKSWPITIFILLTVAVFGIAGVVFYGVVVLPEQRLANDRKACDEFANGVIQARNQSVSLLQLKPPVPEPEVAAKYATTAHKGIDKAFNTAVVNGDIYNSLAQIGLKRLDFNESEGIVAIQKMEADYEPLLALCSSIQPTDAPTEMPSSSATPTTPSPSATN
jgi:hypothetical protein